MDSSLGDRSLVEALIDLASRAGARIMAHYGCGATDKADGSPVTLADAEAEDIIVEGLGRLLPGLPVLAEERAARGQFPASTEVFAAVDPMDGTREFLAGNGEFTVNIALVEAGRPVTGVLYAPARHRLWVGTSQGAEAMALAPGEAAAGSLDRGPIRTRLRPLDGALGLVSRSHPDLRAETYLAEHGVTRRLAVGSSLKYALIAEGSADITVRFAPITEWDIAAGHAILAAAGGFMAMPDGTPIRYGNAQERFRTPAFVASSAALAPA
jgi:3'(2'), 5'-bisphosphate nucleotidase